MNKTESFFVKCIKLGIKNQLVEEVDEGVDFKKLYNLCASHSMSVIVWRALEKIHHTLNDKFVKALHNSVCRHIARDVQGEIDVNSLLEEFESRKIDFLPLKGYHLKKFYPSSEMRYASDFDILIDIKQIKQVRKAVKELNLIVKSQDDHHDIVYNGETRTVFELHKSIFLGSLNKTFGVGFERAKLKDGYEHFYEFSKEDFYISILGHSAYHFSSSAGVGIRHVVDVYLYKNTYDLDYEYLDRELEKCGLLKFKNQFEKLADFFFEDKGEDEFTVKLADYVLESSLLSNEAKQHVSEVAANCDGASAKKAKKQTLFRILFPTVAVMKFTYPILKKAVVLLPLYYLIRWVEVLLTRPKQILRLKHVAKVDENDLKNVREVRENLGINDL